MSTEPSVVVVPTVTIQDLELEHAELLPARETLCYCRLYPYQGHMTPPHTPCYLR